jgi:hypothetical protein
MHCQLVNIQGKIPKFVFLVDNNPNTDQSNEEKTHMDLIVPLAILALCFLLSLGVIIYQRRLIQNNNRQGQENRKGKVADVC